MISLWRRTSKFLNHRCCFQRHASTQSQNLKVFSSNELNFLGYIHGGSILKSLCEDGLKRAEEYIKFKPNMNPQLIDDVVLARMEKVTFRKPVQLNDLIVEKSAVVFVSPHSICVECSLQLLPHDLDLDINLKLNPGNLTTVCNAILWFVPVSIEECDDKHTIKLHSQNVQPSSSSSGSLLSSSSNTHTWNDLYIQYKLETNKDEIQHQTKAWENYMASVPPTNIAQQKTATVPASFAVNQFIIAKEHCSHLDSDILNAAILLRLIDETGAISAMRHINGNCVTGFIDKMNFYNPGIMGHILSVYAQVEYTSKSSVYVSVRAFDENHLTGVRNLICSCVLVFVAITHNNHKPSIPKLVIEHPYEQTRFEEMKKLHEYYRENYFKTK